MQVICVRPIGSHQAGDEAEMPDGAEFSTLYYAKAGSPEAEAASVRAQLAAAELAAARERAEAERAAAGSEESSEGEAESGPGRPEESSKDEGHDDGTKEGA